MMGMIATFIVGLVWGWMGRGDYENFTRNEELTKEQYYGRKGREARGIRRVK